AALPSDTHATPPHRPPLPSPEAPGTPPGASPQQHPPAPIPPLPSPAHASTTAPRSPPTQSEIRGSSPGDHCDPGTRSSHPFATVPDPPSYTSALAAPL